MSKTNDVFNAAIQLEPIEKAKLIDQLIQNLDAPDKEIDQQWAKEAEARLSAFQTGKLRSISLEEVLSKYK